MSVLVIPETIKQFKFERVLNEGLKGVTAL